MRRALFPAVKDLNAVALERATPADCSAEMVSCADLSREAGSANFSMVLYLLMLLGKPANIRWLLLLQLKTMKIVALEKAKPANCGAKAAACAELAKVAAGASFSTPAGICLPFGTMDAAIKVFAPLAMHKICDATSCRSLARSQSWQVH